jgi:hypothetical protein
MSANEFWYGDTRLFLAYKKAYLRNTTYNAWLIGNYNRISVEIGAKNALITKKSDHIDSWLPYKDPTFVAYKEEITAENLEEKFRESQVSQGEWLHNILSK